MAGGGVWALWLSGLEWMQSCSERLRARVSPADLGVSENREPPILDPEQ